MIPLTLVIKKFLFKDKKSRMSVEVNCLQLAQYILYVWEPSGSCVLTKCWRTWLYTKDGLCTYGNCL